MKGADAGEQRGWYRRADGQFVSDRSLDPVVAVARDGSGTVAWISARSYLAPRVWVRSFDVQGRFVAPARPVEVARAAEKGHEDLG